MSNGVKSGGCRPNGRGVGMQGVSPSLLIKLYCKIHKISYLCYSEIRYLERSVEGEQKIARFDVFMDYPVTVQVLQPIHQLAEIPLNKSRTLSGVSLTSKDICFSLILLFVHTTSSLLTVNLAC